MIEELKNETNNLMESALKGLGSQLMKVRTGRAHPSLLDGVLVDYYGSMTAISQVGQISTPEARLLQIQPFDKSMIAAIEKAILGKNLGVTPGNDGNVIRIPFPALTEEKRKDLIKSVRKLGEEAKIQIRNIRRDSNEEVKKLEKGKEISEDDSKKFQDEIQKITDVYVGKVDGVVSNKEKELMTV